MAIRPSREEAERLIASIHRFLEAGYRPGGLAGRGTAVRAAADANEIGPNTLRDRVAPRGSYERLYGLKVEWDRFVPKAAPEPSVAVLGANSEVHLDALDLRRFRDRATTAESRLRDLERHAVTAATLREAVFSLTSVPLIPPSWPMSTKHGQKQAEAIVLPISDIHMGEVIDIEQMGGRNSYNKKIAGVRLQRLFQTIVELGTVHWTGPPPSVIYVVLLGDLISGEIHEELARENDLLSIPAVREVSELLCSGFDLLLKAFPCPIKVLSVPGNHGRTEKKPAAKCFAINSYDTLVAWAIESWYRAKHEKRISFSAPASGDALVNILGWNIVFTHGDRIGSRGGAGFVGPAATAARGMQKMIQDYAAEGTVLDSIVIGHFHTPLELEQGFVNGCLSGPSEYSRSGRFRSHPASQWMLSVHPQRGIARRWKIGVGDPSEGSIYRGRLGVAGA